MSAEERTKNIFGLARSFFILIVPSLALLGLAVPNARSQQYTTSVSSLVVSQVPPVQTNYVLPIVIIVIIAVAAALFSFRRILIELCTAFRPTHRPKQTTLEQYASFCVKCGAELQPSSKFCNKCGAKQE